MSQLLTNISQVILLLTSINEGQGKSVSANCDWIDFSVLEGGLLVLVLAT